MSSVAHAAQPHQPPEQVMVRFGDIQMTERWLVTPQGTVPLAGTQIFVADHSREERYVSTWTIVIAVSTVALAFLGIIWFPFAFLGLLLFFVKETRTTGFMQITVSNGEFIYQTGELASGNQAAQLYELENRANYARKMIARAPA